MKMRMVVGSGCQVAATSAPDRIDKRKGEYGLLAAFHHQYDLTFEGIVIKRLRGFGH